MKKKTTITFATLLLSSTVLAQTLTLVSGKRIYDHHSSSLSGGFYGDYNVDTQSAYDFVNHGYVASGTPSLAPNRDIVEHNGYFGYGPSGWGIQFGFTNAVSNIGSQAAQGNNQTKFFLNNSISFSTLNTVNSLISAYNSSLATSFDTAVAVGNVYIARLRNSNTYIAMKITSISNINQTQVDAMGNQQPVTLDVYFDFDYKYGTLNTTGLDQKNRSKSETNLLKIYPNPANQNIHLGEIKAYKDYKLINALGEIVMQDSNIISDKPLSLNVSKLNVGVYTLELYDFEGNFMRGKFVKE